MDVRPINTKRKLYFSGIDCTEVSVYLHTHKYMYTCVYMYYTMYVSIHRYMGGSLHVCVYAVVLKVRGRDLVVFLGITAFIIMVSEVLIDVYVIIDHFLSNFNLCSTSSVSHLCEK